MGLSKAIPGPLTSYWGSHWPKSPRSHDKAITALAWSGQCAGQRGEVALQGLWWEQEARGTLLICVLGPSFKYLCTHQTQQARAEPQDLTSPKQECVP